MLNNILKLYFSLVQNSEGGGRAGDDTHAMCILPPFGSSCDGHICKMADLGEKCSL